MGSNVFLSYTSVNGQDTYLYPVLDEGIYYIKLTSAGDIDQNKGYDLVYTKLKCIPDASPHIVPDETAKAYIYNKLKTQIFSFDLHKTEILIHFDSGSSVAGYQVDIFDSNESIIQQASVQPSESFIFDPIYIPDTYWIKVSHLSGEIDIDHPFSIYLETTDIVEIEPNDNIWQSMSIIGNKTIKGRLQKTDDKDIYEYILDQDTQILFEFFSNASLSVYIYFSNEYNLMYKLTKGNHVPLKIPDFWKAGTWYIKIIGDLINIPYYLTIIENSPHSSLITSKEPNNHFDTANDATDLTQITGIFPYLDDIDYFVLHSEKKNSVNIDIYPYIFSNLEISIFKDTPSQKIVSCKGNIPMNVPLGMEKGDYYIKITANNIVFQPYIMTIKPSDTQYETEPNDTFQQASTLFTSENVQGKLSTSDDLDIFYINVDRKRNFILNCKTTSEENPILLSLSRGSDYLKLFEIPIYNNQVLDIPIGLNTDRYYFQLSGTTPEQAYELQLMETETSSEILPDNRFQDACPLEENITIHGTLFFDERDYYSFQVPAPSFKCIQFTGKGESTDYQLVVFRNEQSYNIEELTIQKNQRKSLPLGLGKGIYYVQVTSNNGTTYAAPYKISITDQADLHLEIEPNNTPLYATPISKDYSRKGRLFSESDQDWYGFYLTKQTRFEISFSSTSLQGDYEITIFNDNNKDLLQKESIDGASVEFRAFQKPGIYYVQIIKNMDQNDGSHDLDTESFYTLNVTSVDENTPIDANITLVSLTISLPTDTLAIGESIHVSVNSHYSDASVREIYDSRLFVIPFQAGQDVISVNQNQNVKGLANGYASIVASFKGLTARKTVLVGNPDQDTSVKNNRHGNLILVAGGGADAQNILKGATQYLSDHVYSRFLGRLFSHEDIYYFNPIDWHDIDGDGTADGIVDNDSPTVFEFGKKITGWASSQLSDGPLYIYLIDHGGIDTFQLFENENLTACTLNDYLDIFQHITGRPVVVMIEACKSGSFIDNLASDTYDRVVVTSTDEKDGYIHLNGNISFTQFFADYLFEGYPIKDAYKKAAKKLKSNGLPYSAMQPQLYERNEMLANMIQVGGPFLVTGLYPEIVDQSKGARIKLNASQALFVELSDLFGIQSVTAVVITPDYTIPIPGSDFEVPLVTHPKLSLTDPEQDGIYSGTYTGFNQEGCYAILFYAKNIDNHVSVSSPTIIVSGDVQPLIGDFNWDGNQDLADIILGLQKLTDIPHRLFPEDDDLHMNGSIGLKDVLLLFREQGGL